MWKYIEEINWKSRSKKSRGYEDGKMYMLENFTEKRCKEIVQFVSERFTDLSDCINTFEYKNDTHCGDYGGDDSFGDMIHHVIGLGETTFEEIMKDPSKLKDMKFVESFSYCMPSNDDYKMLNDYVHLDRAKEAVVELARILQENKAGYDDVEVIRELMNRFLTMLAGDFKEACQDFDRATYSRYYEFEANDRQALFANYISDCQQFMVK